MAAAAGVAAFDTIDIEFRDTAAVERRAQPRAGTASPASSRSTRRRSRRSTPPSRRPPTKCAGRGACSKLLAAAQGPGAVALDGRMIDRPHVRQAERILAALERS